MGLTIKRAVEIVKKEGFSSFSPEAFAAKKVLMGFYKSRTKSRHVNALTAYSFAYNTSYPKKTHCLMLNKKIRHLNHSPKILSDIQ